MATPLGWRMVRWHYRTHFRECTSITVEGNAENLFKFNSFAEPGMIWPYFITKVDVAARHLPGLADDESL